MRQVWDFDPSGLGEESHFALFWWLSIIALALYVARSRDSSTVYSHLPTQQANSSVV